MAKREGIRPPPRPSRQDRVESGDDRWNGKRCNPPRDLGRDRRGGIRAEPGAARHDGRRGRGATARPLGRPGARGLPRGGAGRAPLDPTIPTRLRGRKGRDRLDAACLAAILAPGRERPETLGTLFDAVGAGTLDEVELTHWVESDPPLSGEAPADESGRVRALADRRGPAPLVVGPMRFNTTSTRPARRPWSTSAPSRGCSGMCGVASATTCRPRSSRTSTAANAIASRPLRRAFPRRLARPRRLRAARPEPPYTLRARTSPA